MTLQELKDKQEKIIDGVYKGQMRSYTKLHLTNLTIQYAIEILEDMQRWWEMGSENRSRLDNKIEELKKQL